MINFNATCMFGHDHAASPCPWQHVHDDFAALQSKLGAVEKELAEWKELDELRCLEIAGLREKHGTSLIRLDTILSLPDRRDLSELGVFSELVRLRDEYRAAEEHGRSVVGQEACAARSPVAGDTSAISHVGASLSLEGETSPVYGGPLTESPPPSAVQEHGRIKCEHGECIVGISYDEYSEGRPAQLIPEWLAYDPPASDADDQFAFCPRCGRDLSSAHTALLVRCPDCRELFEDVAACGCGRPQVGNSAPDVERQKPECDHYYIGEYIGDRWMERCHYCSDIRECASEGHVPRVRSESIPPDFKLGDTVRLTDGTNGILTKSGR